MLDAIEVFEDEDLIRVYEVFQRRVQMLKTVHPKIESYEQGAAFLSQIFQHLPKKGRKNLLKLIREGKIDPYEIHQFLTIFEMFSKRHHALPAQEEEVQPEEEVQKEELGAIRIFGRAVLAKFGLGPQELTAVEQAISLVDVEADADMVKKYNFLMETWPLAVVEKLAVVFARIPKNYDKAFQALVSGELDVVDLFAAVAEARRDLGAITQQEINQKALLSRNGDWLLKFRIVMRANGVYHAEKKAKKALEAASEEEA